MIPTSKRRSPPLPGIHVLITLGIGLALWAGLPAGQGAAHLGLFLGVAGLHLGGEHHRARNAA